MSDERSDIWKRQAVEETAKRRACGHDIKPVESPVFGLVQWTDARCSKCGAPWSQAQRLRRGEE